MGNIPICNCKDNDLENNKRVIQINTDDEKYENGIKEEKVEINQNNQTTNETKHGNLVLISEKHSKKNDEKISVVNNTVEKNSVLSSNRESLLNYKLRSKIAKRTQGRRSVFLNRTNVNIIIVGDKFVGKTSYAIKLKDNKFNDDYIPTTDNEDERFILKVVNGERTYLLNVAIINNVEFIKEAIKKQLDYCLVFYDMNNENSMDFAKNVFENYLKSELENVNNNSLSHVIFIGNKCDLNNNFNNKIEGICNEYKMNHFEISVKENIKIEEMKNKLTQAFDNDEFENRK